MSGNVFSSMKNKENAKMITERGRINIKMDVETWCGRRKGPCDMFIDLKGYELCGICKYQKRFDIPRIIEKEKIKKNGNR